MTQHGWKSCAAGLLVLALSSLQGAESSLESLRTEFQNPGAGYRALAFTQMKKGQSAQDFFAMIQSGRWGGTNMLYPQGSPYLRDPEAWQRYKDFTLLSQQKGLKNWIYDEQIYPSGRAGGQVLSGHPELEARGLFYDALDFEAAPKRKKKAAEAEISWKIPPGKPFLVALYHLDREGRIYGKARDLIPAIQDGVVNLEMPESGTWRIIALVENRLYEGTHAQLTGGGFINILDPAAVKRFIDLTYEIYHQQVGEHFGQTLTAMFNDEVSLMSGFLKDQTQPYPVVAWYEGLPELFKQRAGYDIRESLPALFEDVGSSTTRKRCDFYGLISHQVATSFFKQVRDWCAVHHIASTGHLLWEESLVFHVPFYGSVFPSYKELDWPGMDELDCSYGHTSGAHVEGGPVTPKLVSSAVHLWNKPHAMSESFCFCGPHTKLETIDEVMSQYGWEAVLGINTLTALSIHEHYSAEDLGRFNDFVGRVNSLVRQGRFTADVGILYPIASVWEGYKPTRHHVHNLADNPKAKEVDEAWRWTSTEVLSAQRDFDYLDEDVLAEATVAGGRIQFGQNRYSVLVLPHVTTLRYATVQRLKSFVEQGGTLISWQTLPVNRADTGSAEEHQVLVEELWSRYPARVQHCITRESFHQAVSVSGQADLVVSPANRQINYHHRILPQGDIYFVVNHDTAAFTGSLTLQGYGKAELWDPVNGQMNPVKSVTQGEKSALELTLPPRHGMFVLLMH